MATIPPVGANITGGEVADAQDLQVEQVFFYVPPARNIVASLVLQYVDAEPCNIDDDVDSYDVVLNLVVLRAAGWKIRRNSEDAAFNKKLKAAMARIEEECDY
jgi:hypothetical protein